MIDSPEEKYQAFLDDLKDLMALHGVHLGADGCCSWKEQITVDLVNTTGLGRYLAQDDNGDFILGKKTGW